MKDTPGNKRYKEAGVDITAGYRAVELMRGHVAKTATRGVLEGIGGFSGLFEPDLTGIRNPVLVSGTDGVGTKLKLAFLLNKHDTVGIDCVAMCVNDVLCCGAKPLFFLDYLAVGKNDPERVACIVGGVAEGCVQAGCALIGGETAEMPGFYPEDEYDLAGFCVGIADKERLLDKNRMKPGDVLIALPSSGVHSNGFSLIRRVFGMESGGFTKTCFKVTESDSARLSLSETLLTPTKIYVKAVMALLDAGVIPCSIAHITGGGFYENIPRAMGKGMRARIEKKAVRTPPIFGIIAETGSIGERDMYSTFNMGVGMCLTVTKDEVSRTLALLKAHGEDAYVLGGIEAGEGGLVLC